jgi:Ca-activated chloride channel family protein
MTFRWPWLLAAAAVIPVAIGAYVWSERRKRKYAVQFASLSLIREALPRSSRWRRHVPFALLLVAVASLVLAMGRPQATVPVPRSQTSIILALDVSRSMCSTDVTPNRLAAAEKAADTLIEQQVGGARIGVVAFSGFAQILVPPTTDAKKLTTAIHDLTTGVGGTAIGNGILAAIDAISRVNGAVAPSTVNLGGGTRQSAASGKQYQPDIVVVLTDGANNRGVDPQIAAAQAAARKVRVYTIGFGTDNPGALVCTRDQLGSDPYGGGRFGGGGFGGGFGGGGPGGGGPGGGNVSRFVNEDQQALEAISNATGGTAFRAASAQQLLNVFRKLPSRVVVQHEKKEVGVIFVGAGALLALLALGLSMRWNRSP